MVFHKQKKAWQVRGPMVDGQKRFYLVSASPLCVNSRSCKWRKQAKAKHAEPMCKQLECVCVCAHQSLSVCALHVSLCVHVRVHVRAGAVQGQGGR
jgi:hypothetical protein